MEKMLLQVETATIIALTLKKAEENIGECILHGFFQLDSINCVIFVSREKESLVAPYVVWNINLESKSLYQGRYHSVWADAKNNFAKAIKER